MSSQLLNSLFEQLNNNEELDKFIVTPPASAGSVYVFREPYLHVKDRSFTVEQPSTELMVLLQAFCSAMLTFLSREMAGKGMHPSALLQGRPNPIGDYVLFTAQAAGYATPQPDFTAPGRFAGGGWGQPGQGMWGGGYPNQGLLPPEVWVAVKTPRCLVPVCTQQQLTAAFFAAGGQFGVPRADAGRESLYSNRQPDAIIVDPNQFDAGTGTLAALFKALMDVRLRGRSDTNLDALVDEYIARTNNLDTMTADETTAAAMNVLKQLASPTLNWKTFLKGLRTLRIDNAELELRVTGEGKTTTHRVAFPVEPDQAD